MLDFAPKGKGPDRIDTPDLPTVVVDVGVGGERGNDPVEVEGVDRRDVLGDHTSKFGGNRHGFLPSGRPPWTDHPTLGDAVLGESRAHCRVDSPTRGGSKLAACLAR